MLAELRKTVSELRARIDDYNDSHAPPSEALDREVTVYVGQFVKTDDDDQRDRDDDD